MDLQVLDRVEDVLSLIHIFRLTDAGQTFQSYARTLLITAQQAKAALVPARAVSGTLRVALADSVCSTFLPDLLQQFGQELSLIHI